MDFKTFGTSSLRTQWNSFSWNFENSLFISEFKWPAVNLPNFEFPARLLLQYLREFRSFCSFCSIFQTQKTFSRKNSSKWSCQLILALSLKTQNIDHLTLEVQNSSKIQTETRKSSLNLNDTWQIFFLFTLSCCKSADQSKNIIDFFSLLNATFPTAVTQPLATKIRQRQILYSISRSV